MEGEDPILQVARLYVAQDNSDSPEDWRDDCLELSRWILKHHAIVEAAKAQERAASIVERSMSAGFRRNYEGSCTATESSVRAAQSPRVEERQQ